ncbi:MAG: phosphatase PAP2 family protein [Myxococcota bacterium]
MIALTRDLIAGWRSHLLRHRLSYGIGALALLALCGVIVPRDEAWVAAISADRTEPMLSIARWFSRWGDLTGTVIVAGGLALAAWVRGNARWARTAWALILAAVLAGVAVNVPRVLLGRPRPVSPLPDGFYGPSLDFKLHSFPSAHAGTASATAAVLIASLPVLGVPVAIAAGGVLWSRMHRRRHHLTDVVVGGFIGAVFGIGLGRSARRSGNERDRGRPRQ